MRNIIQPDALITVSPSCRAASAGEEVIKQPLARCHDPRLINAVVNHEDVRPFVGPGGYLDLTPAIAKPENWFLMGLHGGFALSWSAPGVHEVHTFILKSGRGLWARDAARDMIEYARKNGDRMLWTRIHPKQRNVIRFAVENGMRPTGMAVETFGEPYLVYKMEIG